jgi:hypothetical protein
MFKEEKKLILYLVMFIISYLLIGYFINEFMVSISWVKEVTIWQKLKVYYITSLPANIIPTIIMTYLFSKLIIKLDKIISSNKSSS